MKIREKLIVMVETPFGDFPLGTKVLYEVFPFGNKLEGVICSHGIQSAGETASEFVKQGITTFAKFEDSQISNIIAE